MLKLLIRLHVCAMMEIHSGGYQLNFINEPNYLVGSPDNPRTYDQYYSFGEESLQHAFHGIVCQDHQGIRCTCLLLATGVSGIHEHSAIVVKEKCFVAVGDRLCALFLPDLQLLWATKVDDGACFGVHYSESCDCLISHGEQQIARVDFNGKILWPVGGKDIFTGRLWLEEKHVFATDFNDEVYRIEITTGKSEIITL
jgi:hypothetical protein